MVLLESASLGHTVYITSYCAKLRQFLPESKVVDKFENYFNYLADTGVEFTRKNGKFPCPGNGPFLVNHMIKYIECYVNVHRPKNDEE